MKKLKQFISLLLCLVMLLTVFSGCGLFSDGSSIYTNPQNENKDNFFTSLSGPTLPQPDTYFNNQLIRNEDMYIESNDCHCLSYCTDFDGMQAFHDYVSLLSNEKYQFELTTEKEETIYDLNTFTYGFTYTGAEDIPDTYNDAFDVQADLIIVVTHNGSSGQVLMTLYYKPDVFEFKDFGDRTSYTLKDLSDNKDPGPDSDFSDNDYGSALDCIACKGSGDCQKCGGDGLLWSSAADTENRMCPKCHTNRGKCPTCGGTGRR